MKPIRIEDVAITLGIGKYTARRLVREGKLPGFIDGPRYICPPGEFQDWLDGKWQYQGVRSTPPRKNKKQPTPFVQNIRKGKAA